MTDDGPDREFQRKLEARQRRKLRALRRGDESVWFGFGMFGLVGWSVAVPALLLTALGVWIDSSSKSRYSWTLMLLVIGVCLGCLNAWFWLSKERDAIEKELREGEDEEGSRDGR
jgi:ATP synthase protein I